MPGGILCLAGGVKMYGKRVPISHEGNAALFEAVSLSVASTFAGFPVHLHAEGLRGTGKTTVLRWAKNILPRIQRIRGCPYNCDPADPHCPAHRDLTRSEIETLGTERVPMPFIEISHSAKLGTVVGSLDLEKLTDPSRPEVAFLPGTIPRAHRGIILVDEINRLAETAPEITDVLLGVMGTRPGWIKLEESGLPQFELPVMVSVWAASNPDEDPGPLGDIRRQLADRFDLLVAVTRPTSADDVLRILDGFSAENACAEAQPDYILNLEPVRVAHTVIPDKVRRTVAQLYIDFGVESLRAVEAMLHVARIRAAVDHRKEVSVADLMVVAPLTLRHRVDLQVVSKALEFLSGLKETHGMRVPAGAAGRSVFPSSSMRTSSGSTIKVQAGSPEKATGTPPPKIDRPTLGAAGDMGGSRVLTRMLDRIGRHGLGILDFFKSVSPGKDVLEKDAPFSHRGKAPGCRRMNPAGSGGEGALSKDPSMPNEVTSPPVPGRPLSQLPAEEWLVPEAEVRNGRSSPGDDK